VAKPSIFSKNYEEQMKKRKKRILISVCIVIVAGGFITVSVKGTFKGLSRNEVKPKNSITTDKKNTKSATSKKSETVQPAITQKVVGYDIQLSNGKTIKAVYETKGNEKTFKGISPSDSNIFYNISPSGKDIVVFDDKAQSIILLDANGNKQDVTDPEYTSTSGDVITKNSALTSNPNYIWCSSPEFIDDNTIAYISQLPWIGKTSKYVWIENLKDKSCTFVQDIQGENLKLDKLTDQGLTVIEDGKTVFLKADGSVN
jgi:hypothetical protein